MRESLVQYIIYSNIFSLFTWVLIYEVDEWLLEEKIAPLAGPRDQQPAHPLIPELSDKPRINNSLPNSVSPEQILSYYNLLYGFKNIITYFRKCMWY